MADLTAETDADALERVVRLGLAEDVGTGDVTTAATVPPGAVARGALILKEPGVVACLDVVAAVYAALDPDVTVEVVAAEGRWLPGARDLVARVEGPARAVLTGERLALNLVQRLSGVATLTRRFVDAVEGTGCTVLDTRKTTPGLRRLERRAVRVGGGRNHRFALWDAVLVKDNHLAVAGGVAAAVAAARAGAPGVPVEVEASTLAQVREAIEAGADTVLLDNMPPERMREAVAVVAGRARTEASGGIDLTTVRAAAETGVDAVSVGALTHSAPALDLSLDVDVGV